jgi:hypothetical protein
MFIRKPRKSGYAWQFQVRYKGQTYVRSYKDRAAGVLWARDLETKLERGAVGLPQDVTLARAFASFLENRPTLAPATLALYRVYWKVHVKKPFGARLISSITQQELQKWIARLSAGLAAATVHRLARFVAAVLQSSVQAGHLAASPARGLKLPTLVRVRDVRTLGP